MAIPTRPGRTRKAIKRGPGQRIVEGKSFRLADEVRYIQRRAADRDGRIVTIGQLVLFSTETGDAWLLDPADQLAARLAREGKNEPIHIEERYHLRHWLERPLLHRRRGIRLLGSRHRPCHHDPRVPDRQTQPDRLIGKFQICLVSFFTLSKRKGLPHLSGSRRLRSSRFRTTTSY